MVTWPKLFGIVGWSKAGLTLSKHRRTQWDLLTRRIMHHNFLHATHQGWCSWPNHIPNVYSHCGDCRTHDGLCPSPKWPSFYFSLPLFQNFNAQMSTDFSLARQEWGTWRKEGSSKPRHVCGKSNSCSGITGLWITCSLLKMHLSKYLHCKATFCHTESWASLLALGLRSTHFRVKSAAQTCISVVYKWYQLYKWYSWYIACWSFPSWLPGVSI